MRLRLNVEEVDGHEDSEFFSSPHIGSSVNFVNI